MIKRFVLASALALSVMPPVNAYQFEDGSVQVAFKSRSIATAVTGGGNTRGPALAVMKDDTVLLGGGRAGGEIFSFNKDGKTLRKLGSFIPANRRVVDSRFAINDIAILSESATAARLLISYPRLGTSRSCVEIAVDELAYDRKKQRIKFVANWYVTKPCVPISAVQHTAGRFEVIDKNSVYVSFGDLGYSAIDDRSKRGDLGSIFKLSAKSASRVSEGHRNPQGIVMYDKVHLLAAEHGPRGGDELNLIKQLWVAICFIRTAIWRRRLCSSRKNWNTCGISRASYLLGSINCTNRISAAAKAGLGQLEWCGCAGNFA